MMNLKFLLPLLLIASCSPAPTSSIEDDYKEYKSITYNDVTYLKLSNTTFKVARYHSWVPDVTQVKTYLTEYEQQFIYAYLDTSKSPTLTFKDKASFTYTCQKSHNDYTQDVTLMDEIGSFSTYTKVYYSRTLKTIKVVEVTNKSSKESFDYNFYNNKTFYPAVYTVNDEREAILKITTDEHAEGLYFNHKEAIKTIKVDNEKLLDLE